MFYLIYMAVFFGYYLWKKEQPFIIYAVTAGIAAVLSLIVPEPVLSFLYAIAIISEIVVYYKILKK